MSSMTRSVPYTSAIMIRAKLRPDQVAATIARVRRLEGPVLLFFHAAAVDQLQDESSPWRELFDDSSIDMAYCSAAWQRRGLATPPKGIEASTLVRFWDAFWRAGEARSLMPTPEGSAPVRVRIDSARSPQDWSDSLEVLLAAATLDLPLAVEFSASAWASLCSEQDSRAAWQQLLDFDLARLSVRGAVPEADQMDAGVEFLADRPPGSSNPSRVFEL
jgi:hypothetical protein